MRTGSRSRTGAAALVPLTHPVPASNPRTPLEPAMPSLTDSDLQFYRPPAVQKKNFPNRRKIASNGAQQCAPLDGR